MNQVTYSDVMNFAKGDEAAEEWIKVAKTFTRKQILDKAWMTSWFANVSMAGYDTAMWKYSKLNKAAENWLWNHPSTSRPFRWGDMNGETLSLDETIILILDVMYVETQKTEEIVKILDKGIDNLTIEDKSNLQKLVADYKATTSKLLKD